jgi:hypothetical protein
MWDMPITRGGATGGVSGVWHPPNNWKFVLFVYSKSEYTIESVSVSGRLHDNFSQLHPIELKFCIQNCLINISVEFKDENDLSRHDWAIKKIVIID